MESMLAEGAVEIITWDIQRIREYLFRGKIIAVVREGKRMNKDINGTLAALIPVLQMNGENVVSIEAVHDWYKGQYKDSDGRHREYMKEVAEITYASGHVKYADIGCDSNLTACYDVLAVIQQLKPESAVIERIERGVYPSADMRGEEDDDNGTD